MMGFGSSGSSNFRCGGGAPAVGTDKRSPGEVGLHFGALQRKIAAGQTHAREWRKCGRRARRQLKWWLWAPLRGGGGREERA
jgi:hypothetical protein